MVALHLHGAIELSFRWQALAVLGLAASRYLGVQQIQIAQDSLARAMLLKRDRLWNRLDIVRLLKSIDKVRVIFEFIVVFHFIGASRMFSMAVEVKSFC